MSSGTANAGERSMCTMCDKPQSQVCSRCRSTRYCSRECQQADWHAHKLLCRAYSSLPKRPGEEHFIAIVFPPGEAKPKLIWLHCPWHRDGEDEDWYSGSFQFPDLGPFLGKDVMNRTMPIQENRILRRRLEDTIRLGHRDTFLVDGSRPNGVVAAVSNAEVAQQWRGQLVAYGTKGLGIDQTDCRNLNLADFRHIIDWFISYAAAARGFDSAAIARARRPGAAASTGTPKEPVQKVAGVKINCLGDQKVLKLPQYEAVEVPISDSIFWEHDTSDIAARVGLPIRTKQCPPSKAWSDERKWDGLGIGGESPFNNQAATFLHLSCDKGSDRFGWAGGQWQDDVGSVLVVREDRKPLLPIHAEALSRYCQFEVRELFGHSMGEYAPEEPMSRDAVLACISRPTFVVWLHKFMGEKNEYADSPYET